MKSNIIIGDLGPYILHKYTLFREQLKVPDKQGKVTLNFTEPFPGVIQSTVKGEKLSGKTTVFDEQGIVREELSIEDNKREGLCIEWDHKHHLIFRGSYCNDKRHGFGYHYTNGILDYTINYENDYAVCRYKQCEYLPGFFQEFDCKTNKLIAISELDDNFKRIGYCYLYSNRGIAAIRHYNNDIFKTLKVFDGDIMTVYDDNNHRIYEGGFVYRKQQYIPNGRGRGFEVLKDGTTRLVYSGGFRDGVWWGKGEYYVNGYLQYEGYMENGYASGMGVFYKKDGTVLVDGNWDHGFLKVNNRWLDFESGKFERARKCENLKKWKMRMYGKNWRRIAFEKSAKRTYNAISHFFEWLLEDKEEFPKRFFPLYTLFCFIIIPQLSNRLHFFNRINLLLPVIYLLVFFFPTPNMSYYLQFYGNTRFLYIGVFLFLLFRKDLWDLWKCVYVLFVICISAVTEISCTCCIC